MKKKTEKPKRRGVPFWGGRSVFRQASDRRERRRDDEQHSSRYGQGTIPRPLRTRYLESCAGENGSLHCLVRSGAMVFYDAEVAMIFAVFFLRLLLRRNISSADCQKSGGEGKTLGLHSTVFSERSDENT
jgi:hypothetical protein